MCIILSHFPLVMEYGAKSYKCSVKIDQTGSSGTGRSEFTLFDQVK